MYRIGVESILGLQLRGDHLHMKPCIPAHWPGFELTYRYKTTFYRIKVVNKGASQVTQLELDAAAVLIADGIALIDDQKPHNVTVTMG
jgi:cyclic beta-1,2-glucan synthetase